MQLPDLNKIYQLPLCLLFILTIGLPLHAQDFEGVIYYNILELEQQGVSEMPYMIKDSKVRMEMGDGTQQGAMLFIPDEEKMVIIIEEMRGFMAIDLNESESDYSDKYENSEMTKTGNIKTIAETDCEVWSVTSDESDYEICMAEGMGTFMTPENPLGKQNAPAWAKEIMKNGLMPLEVIELRENGSEVLQMVASRIEKKKLDAALFEIPEGYRDMSGMMQQMMKQNR